MTDYYRPVTKPSRAVPATAVTRIRGEVRDAPDVDGADHDAQWSRKVGNPVGSDPPEEPP
jgi:hypothetical protein